MEGLTMTLMETSQNGRRRRAILLAGLWTGFLLFAAPTRATDAPVPWECSGYTGEAQTRCIQTLIEIRREQLAKLEGQLKAQEGTIAELKEQADSQAAAAVDLQRQVAAPPVTVAPVPYVYPYVYGYPPVGFSLYLGRPIIYGPPFFYGPSFNFYWGPRNFGHRGHWHRHR